MNTDVPDTSRNSDLYGGTKSSRSKPNGRKMADTYKNIREMA